MKKSTLFTMVTLLIFSASAFSGTKELRDKLFRNADFQMAKAKEMQCPLLAPESFEKAMKYYQRGEERFNKGESEAKIKGELITAITSFKQAVKTAELAALTFKDTLEARTHAREAEALKYEADNYTKAEKRFHSAIEELEDGDLDDAKTESAEARQLYKTAELGAIKAGMFSNTEKLHAQADDLKVKKYAPKTLHDSQLLLSQAEKALNSNRYDTDNEGRNLIKLAETQAQHSLFLTGEIKKVKDKALTMEELLLKTEEPLIKIGESVGLTVRFSKGYSEPTELIVNKVKEYQKTIADTKKSMEELMDENQSLQEQLAAALQKNTELTESMNSKDSQITVLKEKESLLSLKELEVIKLTQTITDLQSQMGENKQAAEEIKKKLERQEEINALFKSVEKMFTPQVAQVFRQGDNVIIRLVGLNFASGKADIEPKYFNLLGQVQNAIRSFKNCSVDIEGHTDNVGSDKKNMDLSKKRADAVRQYILANTDLDVTKINAVGYGKEKPAASNDTPEGRAKNRRIDVVITPVL